MKIRCINNRYKDTWSDVERKYLFLTEGEIYEVDENKWYKAKDFNTVPIVIEDGSKVYFQKKRFEPVEDIPRYVDTEDLVKPVKGITLGEYERMRREEEKVVEGAKFELVNEDKKEQVNHPNHYAQGRKYEPIDVITDWELGFNLGNTVKYISRAGRKDDAIQDLEKALFYLQYEINRLKNKK